MAKKQHSKTNRHRKPAEPPRRRRSRLWAAALLLLAVAATVYAVREYGNGPKQSESPGGQPDPNGDSMHGGPMPGHTVDSMRLPFGGPETWREMDDPSKDGWDAEVVNSQVSAQWKRLAERLRDPKPLAASDVQELAANEFQADPLLPTETRTTFDDGRLHVQRLVPTASREPDDATGRGPDVLAKRLNELRESLQPMGPTFKSVGPRLKAGAVQFKAKVVRVDCQGRQAVTRQLIELAAHSDGGRVEQHATWLARWLLPETGKDSEHIGAPRLLSLELRDWQQSSASQAEPLMADCTASILANNDVYRTQFLRGMNFWFEQLQDTRYMALLGTPGLAVGDVNGDGLEDLYACQETGLPNRLFLQQADGTAVESASDWNVDWLDSCRGALLVDLDNDGDQDLAVATVGAILIASNEGASFQIRDALACDDDTMSLCAADYDNDGDLDLYVCVQSPNEKFGERQRKVISGMGSAVYFDAMSGGRNRLFRNDTTSAAWRFTDVTSDTGLDAGNARVSFAASWDDFDNDGDQDLYVANDFGPNNLYRNDRAEDGRIRFVDVADEIAAEDRAFGMSAAWGDYDRDGNMDVYVGNMFSSAGQRITHQPQFKSENARVRSIIQRMARGNTLLRNQGGKNFEDVSVRADVTVGRWSWSSLFVDLNNDGWDDLLVANGYITTDDTGDL